MAVLSTTVGKESHRRNRASLIVNKSKLQYFEISKNDGMTCLKREEGYLGAGLKSDYSLSPHWWENVQQNHRTAFRTAIATNR